jgi:hypothetical protein
VKVATAKIFHPVGVAAVFIVEPLTSVTRGRAASEPSRLRRG